MTGVMATEDMGDVSATLAIVPEPSMISGVVQPTGR
jgi:hypothetical protein